MLYAALAFAAGIAAAAEGAGGRWALAAAMAAALLTTSWAWRRRGGGMARLQAGRIPAALLVLVALAGWARGRERLLHPPPPDSLTRAIALWQHGARGRLVLGGYVRDAPQALDGYQRFAVQAAYVAGPLGITGVHGAVRVDLRSARPVRGLTAGQEVEFAAHFRPLRRYRDPGVGDFTRAERRAGIDCTASVKPAGLRLLAANQGPWPLRLRAALWSHLSRTVDALAPPRLYPRVNALLRGMVLGDHGRLNPAMRRDFQVDGIYHVLVVAGLHLGILALFLVWFFRRCGLPPLGADCGCLALLAIYVWTIAGRTPTLRVLLMLAVYFAARYWYRERRPMNAVGLAGLVLLLWRPLDLFAPGFQMSFGAALLLAGIIAPLLHVTTVPRLRALRRLRVPGEDEAFPAEMAAWRASLRLRLARLGPAGLRLGPLAVRAALALGEVIAVSVILQWGLAPLMIAYFHRPAPWAGVVNAVVVPAVSLLLPAAWCLAGFQLAAGFVPAFARQALDDAATALLRFAHAAAGWPLAAARTPTPPPWALGLFAVAVVFWFWAAARAAGERGLRAAATPPPAIGPAAAQRENPPGSPGQPPSAEPSAGDRPTPYFLAATLGIAVLAAALAWFPFPPRLPRGLTMTALDVGQGDAIFVTFPGGKTLLVDAGPKLFSGFNAGRAVVAPYLWSLGLRHLDCVLLTHGHMDHMGGMPYVLRHFSPGALWVTHSLPSEAAVQNLLALARQLHIPIRRRYQGERFRVGRTELDVLWPPLSYRAGKHARNRDSMVIRISDGNEAMLLEGDAEAPGERGMLASGMPLASEVLKVGHHGSRTSSLPLFLAAVRPDAALVSVGAGNTYGLPDAIVLRHLKAAGADVFRTDRMGAVEAQFTPGRLRVFRFRPLGGALGGG